MFGRTNIRPVKNGLNALPLGQTGSRGARLLPQSYQYPNLSEGADRVGGQLREDKECPVNGVTKSGRIWRKVPESDTRSVPQAVIQKELVVTKGAM